MPKSRMFHLGMDKPIDTWCPVIGCLHHCYRDKCWASILVSGKLSHTKKWRHGFHTPAIWEAAFKKKFKKESVCFVCHMSDLFGKWVKREWILRVLDVVKMNTGVTFLLETKNPERFMEFADLLPRNVIISTTIESDIDHRMSVAPPPRARYLAMLDMKRARPDLSRHISIEPIMDFNMATLIQWIAQIEPYMVSVGYDNYNIGLPEPELPKTLDLIKGLEHRGIKVERKSIRHSNSQCPRHML